MNTVIIRILITETANPRKVRLVQVFLEEHEPMIEHWLWIIFIESYKEADDGLLLVWCKFRDWAAL